ncbi:MAG: hypothetical protein JSC085_000141 [Candidatus Tokpelaia sp. JSC085]|nr:MAG: hypothetical protein JSC085_000141 [Candidatus Tokpelaia sp. JSC085]
MEKGIEIRQAHFPKRAPVDVYGNGGFRFADMSHCGSILCLPSGIYGWYPEKTIPALNELSRVLAEANDIEILLVGTGEDLCLLSAEVCDVLHLHHIIVEPMSTGAAVRTFNVLLSEDRAVAAALFAVQ